MCARPGSRLMPLTGALFVLLAVIGFAVGGETPGIDGTPTEIRADYDNEGKHHLAAYLVALASVALLFFAGHWRAVLRTAEPRGRLANVALAGAAVAAAGFLVAALIHSAVAEAAQEETFTDPGLQALNALDNWSFYPFSVGIAVFMLSSGIALVWGRVAFPAWVGIAALVIGILQLVPFLGFFAFLAAGAWILAVSLMLVSGPDRLQGAEERPPGNRHLTPGGEL